MKLTALFAFALSLSGQTLLQQNVDFRSVGGKPARTGTGTVSVSGATVTGVGSNFASLFAAGNPITVYDTFHAGTGYITSQPIGPAEDGVHPAGSLVSIFGGGTTTGLASGDTICTPLYGGNYSASSVLQNVGKCWTVDQIIDSTHFTTPHVMYPQVGSGQNACSIIVKSNLGYVTCNTATGKATGSTTTISGTGTTALNTTYTVTNAPVGFALDPTSSTAMNITTSGVADGYYVSNSNALSGVTPTAPTSCVILTNVATCTFLQWPGFTSGDTFRIAGASTGTCANLNGTQTVSTVGTGDYPRTITFATSGVNNGTCADALMLFGSTWTYSVHPQRRIISTVTSNTSLTVTVAFSPNFPSGSTYQNTPDNSAAFLAACSTGQSIFMADGDYHVNNSTTPLANRQCNNFSKEWRMSGGARWVLDDVTYGGFWFQGGTRPIFSSWTLDFLYVPPASNNGLQPGIEFRSISYPTISNFRATGGNGNVISMEFCDHPIIDNVQMKNIAGGILLNGTVDAVVGNFSGENGRDEIFAIYKAPNTCPSCVDEERGVVLTGFHFKNTPNIQVAVMGDVRITNGVMEGSIGAAIRMNNQTPATNASSKVQVSNALLKGAGMLGPAAVWNGDTAVIAMADQTWVDLSSVQIISAYANIGGILMWNSDALGTLKLTGGSIAGLTSYGVQFNSKRLELNGTYLEELGDSCVVSQTAMLAALANLTCKNVAKLWGGGAGSSYGANYAVVFNSDTEFRVDGLHLIDLQAAATGYKLLESGTGTAGSFYGLTANITDGAHPFAWTVGTPAKVRAYDASTPYQVPFASLGTPANGTITPCSDCTIASPCASGGTGAVAKRLNGGWTCN